MTEQKFKTEEAIKFTKTVEGKYTIGDEGRIDTYNEKDNTYSVKSAGQIIIDVPENNMQPVFSGIDKNVDEYLRQKESKNTFKDSDVRVGGAKKELLAYKGMINIDDLKKMEEDSVIAKSLVKKDRAYPQINTTEQIDKGVSGGTLFLKMELRRICGSYPPDTAQFRALYVGLAEWLYQLFDDAITMDDFEWRRKLFVEGVIRKSLLISNPEIEPELIKQNEYYQEQELKEYEYRDKKDDKKEVLNKLAVEAGVSSYDFSKLKEAFPEQYKEYDYWNNLYIIADKYSSYKILPLEYKFLHSLSVNQGGKTISILTEKDISNGVYVLSDLEYLKGYTSQVKYELISSVFGDKFLNFVRKISSDTVTKIYEQAKKYEAFTLEEYNTVYEKEIKPKQEKIKEYKEQIEYLSSPEKTLKEKSEHGLKHLSTWGYGNGASRTNLSDMLSQTKNGRSNRKYDVDKGINFINRIITENWGLPKYISDLESDIKRLEEKYTVRENNYSFLEDDESKVRKKSGEKLTDLTINSGVPLSFIKRNGGVAVYDTDVDTGDKIHQFYKSILGITRITYGISLPDSERMAHSKHFAASIIDLAETLNWDVKELTGLGNLGIKFAASGHGRAMAHYEPSRIAINLTRGKGDGTVAHEMTHYIDNMLPKKFPKGQGTEKGHAIYGSYTKDGSKNIGNENIMAAMDTLMTFIVSGVPVKVDTLELGDINKTHPAFLKIEPLIPEFISSVLSTTVTVRYQVNESKIPNKPDTIEQAIEQYKRQYPSYFDYNYYLQNKSTGNAKKLLEAIVNSYDLKFYDFTFTNNPKQKRTNFGSSKTVNTSTAFYLKNKAMKSSYWTFDWELLARGMETYIFDKLSKQGRSNNYLVSGANFNHDSGVYAFGIEREILYILYDHLIETIKTEMHIADFVPFRNERIDEYVLLNEDDTEKRSVVVDDETSEVISSTQDEEEEIKKGTKLLEELIIMLKSGKNKLEEGGEINSNELVTSLFSFAEQH